jgi:sugar phosphate isomerase/epimerase
LSVLKIRKGLSVTTDYAADTGDPGPYLRAIAAAGFTHVHWCHHWEDDFIYSEPEVEQLRAWLAEYGLAMLDLHSSIGVEKVWCSPQEYRRRAGVELVKNRIEMVATLACRVVIMHTGGPDPSAPDLYWTQIRRSLDELAPVARANGVRIALENGAWSLIRGLLAEYPPDFLGLCYDSGHGNLDAKWRKRVPDLVPASLRPLLERFPPEGGGLDELELVKNRLISVHLHDNDGQSDLHNPIFSGTVDWPRLARILATSSYTGPVSMEVTLVNSGFTDEAAFLAHAFDTGTRFAGMIGQA